MLAYVLSIVALFFLSVIASGGAGYIILVWLTEAAFRGECPLTIEERVLRRKAGKKLSMHKQRKKRL